MSNEHPHINPWAEKLQQAPLPDADASWKGMERLLDQHMPTEKKEKKRRFFFLLFSALLLVGTVIYFGYWYSTEQRAAQHGTENIRTGTPASDVATPVPHRDKGMPGAAGAASERHADEKMALDSFIANKAMEDSNRKGHTNMDVASRPVNKGIQPGEDVVLPVAGNHYVHNNTAEPSRQKGSDVTDVAASAASTTSAGNEAGANGQLPKATAVSPAATTNKKAGVRYHATANNSNEKVAKLKEKQPSANGVLINNNLTTAASLPPVDAADAGTGRTQMLLPFRSRLQPMQQLIEKDSARLLQHRVVLSDSVWLALKNKKSEEHKKGWTFSVGVNHFIRINDQQAASRKGQARNADSEGLTGKIADYVPVPQARYHFNNKVFVQGELQFNAPQFTQPVQLEQRTYHDGVFEVSDIASLKKLTYFNLPVSAHYRLFKNLYVGTGVQFSRLSSAVVLYEKSGTSTNPQFPDTTFKISKQQRIKNDTVFQKLHTTEFRLLGDVSYQSGPLALGLRYNHALQGLVKVPVAAAGGAVTQVRNSSLQLYLRYRFLDKRKRVQPGSK